MIGIIGSAGRRDDKSKYTLEKYVTGLMYCQTVIDQTEETEAVSGGAAYTDHMSVELYLTDFLSSLHLVIPCEFADGMFVGVTVRNYANTLNYYHKQQSEAFGYDTRLQIKQALEKGATYEVAEGFHTRNLKVGNLSDYLLAFTFGTRHGLYSGDCPEMNNAALAGLKSGGTAHTWNNSRALSKEHVNLNKLESKWQT